MLFVHVPLLCMTDNTWKGNINNSQFLIFLKVPEILMRQNEDDTILRHPFTYSTP